MSLFECLDIAPSQSIKLTPTGGILKVNLQAMKWHRTDSSIKIAQFTILPSHLHFSLSVTLFVVDNHGAPVSTLTRLHLYGVPTMQTDVSKIHEKKGWSGHCRLPITEVYLTSFFTDAKLPFIGQMSSLRHKKGNFYHVESLKRGI